MDNKPRQRLRPVVYTSSRFEKHSDNRTKQLMLLKALQVTQDPEKLRVMLNMRRVADVYRTLDKLSMRREYHDALTRLGISFDFIAGGIKDIAVSSEKDDTRLKAYQTLLKSVGLEKYDSEGGVGAGSWEEVLLQKIEEGKLSPGQPQELEAPPIYDVTPPIIPESVKKMHADEDEMTSSIYDTKDPDTTK